MAHEQTEVARGDDVSPSGNARRVLVTGSAGFIGRCLVARLNALGVEVHGVDLRSSDHPTRHMNVTDASDVCQVFESIRPTHVVHCAAIVDDRGDPAAFQKVNVQGTAHIIHAASVFGVQRLVHLSSIAALGMSPERGADEYTPLALHTGSPYFDTKAASEHLVRQIPSHHALDWVVVRPGDVYGPGSVPWVQRPLDMMRRGLPVMIAGGQGLMAHVWVDNLVDGLISALERPEAVGQIFQFTDGVDVTTYRHYFECLAAAAGVRVSTVSMPKSLAVMLGAVGEAGQKGFGMKPMWTRGAVHYLCRQSTYSIRNAADRLGYRPRVDLAQAMAQLAQNLSG